MPESNPKSPESTSATAATTATIAPSTPSDIHSPGHVPSSIIHNQLRERMLNRAATFSEGSRPSQQPHTRRRSSLLSEYSDTRHSFRSSTDSLLRSTTSNNDMDQLASSNEPSVWHSAPLAFAILPAVGGLLFQNGSAHVTDILLLGFASMFLNWCVRAPWDWYFAAQQVQYIDPDDELPPGAIPEEGEESDVGDDTPNDERSASPDPASPSSANQSPSISRTTAQEDAQRELAHNELMALMACFAGPLIGAYLLHAIRSQLTRPAEGLVSNYNLTIFIMAAEIRPVSHMIKLSQARMIHLQRIVRGEPPRHTSSSDTKEISNRLTEIETRLAEAGSSSHLDTLKISSTVRQALQPQLDALNRAVRRYEKRQTTQTIQIEARFGEIDTRLKDTLALAAAAARTGQRPGALSVCLTWIVGLVTYAVRTCWSIALYPYRVMHGLLLEISVWFTKVERQPQKRFKGQSNGNSFAPTSRSQSRSGR